MNIRSHPFIAIAVLLIVLFAAIQLFPAERTNPPVNRARTLEAHVAVPDDVAAIMERSCRDCHSHDTRWPWYSRVAPVSWLLAMHVRDGRDEMNWSEWSEYDPEDADHLLEEVCETVTEGEMPLPPYLPLHPDAKLSEADVKRLCEWSNAAREELKIRATATP